MLIMQFFPKYKMEKSFLLERFEKLMGSLKQIISEFCTSHGWKFKCSDDKQTVSFTVSMVDNTEQDCIASILPSNLGNLVEFMSEIGPFSVKIHRKFFIDLLQINQSMVYARTQIDSTKTKIAVVARTLASSTLQDEIELMIKEVALNASKLRKKFENFSK